MEFNVNSPILFVLAGAVVLFVLAQSIYFLIKAWRRGREIGMDESKMKRIAKTAIVFTIAPAIAIVISVITLAKDLGVALPWLRLSVIGSLSYETIAATNAESAMGLVFGQGASLSAQQYITIVAVMTISILVGPWLSSIVGEKLQKGIINIEKRDKRWSELLSASMFIGMISAFIGYVFSDILNYGGDTVFNPAGFVPVCVFAVAAVLMLLSGLLLKKTGWRWIGDYALPISLIGGMASAIPFTALLGLGGCHED